MAAFLFGSVHTGPVADIDKMPFDCGCRGHHRADQVGPAAFTLAAFEIAIRDTRGAFTGKQHVIIHGDAHTAARIPPLETGIAENLVEPFLFSLRLDSARAGHD